MVDSSISFHSRPASQWLEENLPGTQIGDKRLKNRLQVVGGGMIAQPGNSIPKIFPDVSPMEAAYNFMDNDKTDPDKIQHDHKELTRRRIRECVNWVLMIQDTSTFAWSHFAAIKGLGPIGPSSGAGSGGQGFFLHTTLAVEITEQGEGPGQVTHRVLGLANQQFLVRPPGAKGKGGKGLDRSKGDGDGERLESEKWIDGLANLEPAGADEAPRIVVADREADTWELMTKCREMRYGFCIRASRDRVLAEAHRDEARLMEHIRAQPSLASHALYLRARPGKAARTASMHVSVSRGISLRSPQRPGARAGSGPPITVDVVRVWEEGGERLEWILLVSNPVETAEDALLWTRIYSTRWLIEEYHKALKTGMKAEGLQLETGKRLMTAVSVMAVVALRLLALRETARVSPDSPAEDVGLEAEELEVLRALTKKKPVTTAHDVLMAIGRLGGHLGRKGDGPPGWITLWRGYMELKMVTMGYLLAKQGKR